MTITADFSLFDPTLALFMEEAFERAGVAPRAIGVDHIDSAKRSIHFMLNSEWNTIGMRQWMIERAEYQTTTGLAHFNLPVGAIDIFDAVLRRDGNDTPIERMSRAEYLEIPNKTLTGRPDRYFVDRQYNTCAVSLWRTPENSTDIIIYDYFRQMAKPGSAANTLMMPPHALEAFCAGLAARLALKFNEKKFGMLQTYYRGPDPNKIGGMLDLARMEDRDRADSTLFVQLAPRSGRM